MTHFISHKNDAENGFIIYLALGFILLLTLLLSSTNTYLMQQASMKYQTIHTHIMLLRAQEAMQMGLLRLKGEIEQFKNNESEHQITALTSDAEIETDRDRCLQRRGFYQSLNQTDYLSSHAIHHNNIKSRFYLHDITAEEINAKRIFEIYGCALQNDQTRLTHGIWQFNSEDEGAFELKTIQYF